MKIQQKQAFTLVELIVVITILAILGTIAFISLQGYAKDARDSTRLADLKSIEKALEFQLLKGSKIPQPDDFVEITASGTVISYQGYAGDGVLGKISVHGKGKDPLDDTYYTYLTDINLSNYQLMGFLEGGELISYNNSILNQTKAIDYSERHPLVRGKPLGIIVNSTTKEPLQVTGTGIDIVTETEEYEVHFVNNSKLVGSGIILQYLELSSVNGGIKDSCKSILNSKESLLGNDGTYIIDPELNNPFLVYCDMTTDGGGWTMFSYLGGQGSGYPAPGNDNYGILDKTGKSNLNIHGINFSGIMGYQFSLDNYIIFDNINTLLFKEELLDTAGEITSSTCQTDIGFSSHKGKVAGVSFSLESPITIFEIHRQGWDPSNIHNWIMESGTRGAGRAVVNNLSFSSSISLLKDENGNLIGDGNNGLFFR